MLHYQLFFTIFCTIVLFVRMFVTHALGVRFRGIWKRVRKKGRSNWQTMIMHAVITLILIVCRLVISMQGSKR